MIAYILLSYVFMFVWCVVVLFIKDLDTKEVFKIWVLSPLSMPLILVCKFINW